MTNKLLFKVTGELAAWVHNKLFLANRHFRNKAFGKHVFTVPDYKSFFVMMDNVPYGGDSKMTSAQPFQKELVEVVKVGEMFAVAWKSYMDGLHS